MSFSLLDKGYNNQRSYYEINIERLEKIIKKKEDTSDYESTTNRLLRRGENILNFTWLKKKKKVKAQQSHVMKSLDPP